MFKFFYIAVIVLLIAVIAFAGWKFRGRRNSHRIAKDNKTWEAKLNENGAYMENQIVFFGDSEISLWPMQSSFGVLPLKNRGLSGDLVTQSMERYMGEAISLNPNAIVLLMGTNDLADGVLPSDILKGIQALIDEGKQANAKIIVCSLLPVNSEVADNGRPIPSIIEINTSLSGICQKEELEFVNFYNALIDENGFFDKKYSDDGLHPNKEGYLVMSGIILPYLLKLL
jgi:lysophospholipase L1-like esterase